MGMWHQKKVWKKRNGIEYDGLWKNVPLKNEDINADRPERIMTNDEDFKPKICAFAGDVESECNPNQHS